MLREDVALLHYDSLESLVHIVHCEVTVFTDAALSLVSDVPLIAYELGLLDAVAFKYMCIT